MNIWSTIVGRVSPLLFWYKGQGQVIHLYYYEYNTRKSIDLNEDIGIVAGSDVLLILFVFYLLVSAAKW